MPLEIVRQDITKMQVDVIVNTANPKPVVGGGVDSAVHRVAGKGLLAARRKIGSIPVGDAVSTEAFGLPAKYVIHTVGPVWQDGRHHEADLLAACYRHSLILAAKLRAKTIAFPLISAGTYGFPRDKAISTALQTITDFLLTQEMTVYLVLFDGDSFLIGTKLFDHVKAYIDNHYSESALETEYRDYPDYGGYALQGAMRRRRDRRKADAAAFSPADSEKAAPQPFPVAPALNLDDQLAQCGETWSESLLKLIDKTGKKDADVYKKANVDRKLFSKIRTKKDYQPSKNTALAFAVALQLSFEETCDFIRKAGFALTHSSKADIIVEYYIKKRQYDINLINLTLFEFHQPTLGMK